MQNRFAPTRRLEPRSWAPVVDRGVTERRLEDAKSSIAPYVRIWGYEDVGRRGTCDCFLFTDQVRIGRRPVVVVVVGRWQLVKLLRCFLGVRRNP